MPSFYIKIQWIDGISDLQKKIHEKITLKKYAGYIFRIYFITYYKRVCVWYTHLIQYKDLI